MKTRRAGLPNIIRNVAWLLGGKGFGAVCSLGYLAILSRSLGVKDFGHFSLIFATALALVALASFQTWQTVVKFGAEQVHGQDWNRFGRLVFTCGGIDVIGAMLGCGLAAFVFYGFGPLLELNPRYIDVAFWFACALLWSRMTTPNGIVRVMDRFDLGTYVEAVVPAGRLIASVIIMFVGPTVERFLFAWALFDVLVGLLYWIVAWRLVPRALRRANIGKTRLTLRENVGLPRFFTITYISSSLDALFKQGPLLAIGFFLGTSAAGLYRLADQLALGVARVANLVARAALPEFVMARVSTGASQFRSMVGQVTVMATAGGLIVTLCAIVFGDEIMLLMGGSAFREAGDILLPVAIAAALGLAAVAFEPLLYSTSDAHQPLLIRAFGAVGLGLTIFIVAPQGVMAIGWSVAAWAAVVSILMGLATRRSLRALPHGEST